jgi:hypothetical protein
VVEVVEVVEMVVVVVVVVRNHAVVVAVGVLGSYSMPKPSAF